MFRYSSLIADAVGGYVTPPPQGSEIALGGQIGIVNYGVWAFGFSLLALGGNMLRSAFMSAAMGGGTAGGMGMAGGMSPEMLDSYMQQAMAAPRGVAAQSSTVASPAKEVVKVKCRNCGSLEAEDAAFCRKCGQAL